MDRHQVHVRVVVRVERPDVPPVAAVAIGRAGHVVVGEVVDLRLPAVDEHRDDVAAHVVDGPLVAGVDLHGLEQRLRREDVVAHGRVRLVRRVGQPWRVGGLLEEGLDAATVRGRPDDTELVRLGARHPDPGHGHAGA